MKKILTLCLLAAAVTFSGCESLGLTSIKMDSEQSVERVAETIKKHIDPAQYKPLALYWYEREELSNKMEYLMVTVVGTDGKLYTQSFKVGGDHQGPNEVEEARSNQTYDFATVNYLSSDDLAPATIAGQIAQAKTMIPEGIVFESIANYTFDIDPETGEKTSNFVMRVTEEGNKTSVEGRRFVTTYYEIEFDVLADGTVVMEDLEE